MYSPKEGTRRFNLYQIVKKYNGVTSRRVHNEWGLLGYGDRGEITGDLNTLVKKGVLKKIGDIYFPLEATEEVEEIVQSREPFEFKPLKTFLPKESPRGQPIERRSFQICKSKIKPTKNDF